MMLETRLAGSLDKIFPDEVPAVGFTGGSLFQNEPYAFQIAYRGTDRKRALYVRVKTDLAPVSQYRVDYVPLLTGDLGTGDELRTAPGLYPDILRPRLTNAPVENDGFWLPRYYEQGEAHLLYSQPGCWQSLWFSINEDGDALLPAGEHTVTVAFYDQDTQALLASETVMLTVLPACLPPQTLLYTNWLHCDCLADAHGTGMFDDAFFTILEDYARKATRNGMNMVLLPAFTPPLDTPVGKERRTAQLVGVTATGEGEQRQYTFDFSLMKCYVDACRRGGTTHFEHSHLFSQWGAKTAPKILATVDGEERQIFGWDTPSTGAAYSCFLRQYIPAVRAFLRTEGLEDKTLFHISDEPQENHLTVYREAAASVAELLEGCLVGDALSNYAFYEQGIVKSPIVATSHLEAFLGKCDHLWCYYTGAEAADGLSNRHFSLPSARARVIGLQMYRHDIKGFLNWGYNYYYDVLSHGFSDPSSYPGSYSLGDGGYVVYPGRDGTAVQSLRLKAFGEGVVDMRALQLLESLIGREKTCALLDELVGEPVGFHTTVDAPAAYLRVREGINQAIMTYL